MTHVVVQQYQVLHANQDFLKELYTFTSVANGY